MTAFGGRLPAALPARRGGMRETLWSAEHRALLARRDAIEAEIARRGLSVAMGGVAKVVTHGFIRP